MNDNIKNIQQYLNRILDDTTIVQRVDEEIISRLPHSIISYLELYTLRFLNNNLLLAIIPDDDTYSPAQVKKQQQMIERITGQITVFAFRQIASYNVQRMISQRVNFIVPDKQMFIPSLLMDLRPNKKNASVNNEHIPAMAQCIVLYHIQIASLNKKITQDIADLLDTSYPNVNRAVKWLCNNQIISLEGVKTKAIKFVRKGKQLWDMVEPMLTSPIERVVYTDVLIENKYMAGVNALSEYSMINPNREHSYAIGKEEYKIKHKSMNREYGNNKIEVWKYNPSLLTQSNIVDRLSLYLSLRDNEDERIQIELETMINEMIW